MIVRERTPLDLPGCVAVLREVHESDSYPDLWPDEPQKWLTPAGFVEAWVAADDRILGHIVLVADGGDLWVSRLFVRPGFRGSQVGEALLDAVRRSAADTPLKLGVVQQSAPAIALYERTGWTKIGQRPADWVMADGTRVMESIYRAD